MRHGDLFFFGRLRRLLRGSETESNAKGTPSQGAFGAEGLGRLFVCMNPRAHEALFRDAERHAAPSEHGGLCRAVGRRRSVAGVEEVRSVGAVRPIGWEGSRSEREGTRVRGEGGAAGRQQGGRRKLGLLFFPNGQSWVTDARRISRFQS